LKLSERISWLKKTIQENLFPHMAECLDDHLTEKQKDLIMILEVIEIEKHVKRLNDSGTGRPPEDCCALARSFVAKAVYNLDNTRILIDILHNIPSLRKICGFVQRRDIPSESTFSRAFAEFAATDLGDITHEDLVDIHLSGELIGHASRDATAIEGNEKPLKKEKKEKTRKKRGRPKKGEVREPIEEKRLFVQVNQTPSEALKDIPTSCDVGTKKNSQVYKETWVVYKLHIDAACNGLPLTAVLSSASLHDSQVAIPMMKLTAQKVTSLYDLMDSAYDAESIYQVSRSLDHLPIIDKNPRSGLVILMAPADALRYKTRTVAETYQR